MSEPTVEQAKLHADLLAAYGPRVCHQAHELSGLTLCLVALATDELSGPERQQTYRLAGAHLARLLETCISTEESTKLGECAKRMDAAIALWVMDDLEEKQGLPRSANDA